MAAPEPPARKRRGRPLALIIALSLALILATVAGVLILTRSSQQLNDPTNRITLTVPRVWTDDTPSDAGQLVEQAGDELAWCRTSQSAASPGSSRP